MGSSSERKVKKTLVLTQPQYKAIAAKHRYCRNRWPYLSIAARWAAASGARSVLELGAYWLPIVADADTMDRPSHPGPRPTVLHDAAVIPWPVDDGKYDLFIALQVWEHLGTAQAEAFREVLRVARHAILSFPYKWDCPADPVHHGIDEQRIAEWTCHEPPAEVVQAGTRILYRWDWS